MVYTTWIFDRSGIQKDSVVDGSGKQKDGFRTGMVYRRTCFGREWYAKELILDGSSIQKDRFWTGVVYKRMDVIFV